jgi:hypothetical protein
MARKIQIVLIDNPSINNGFTIQISAPNYFFSTTTATTFVTTPTNSNQVAIGVNKAATVVNLYNNLVTKFTAQTFISVEQTTNGADITINDDDATSSTIGSITGDITVTHSDIVVEPFTRDNIILSRSPFNLLFSPSALFDIVAMNLGCYRGEQTADAPTTPTFPLSKAAIQAGQDTIRFEISKLVNDYTKNNIPTFGSTGVFTSSQYDSVWIDAEVIAYYYGAEIGTAYRKYLAIDGYGWHTELYNPKLTTSVLTSNTSHVVYRGSDAPLYFVSLGLESIEVDGVDVPFTLDTTINNQIIAYINVGAYITTQDSFDVVFTYDYGTETHTFTVKDNCKYPLYNCWFKNKYGFWQSIPFNLRSKVTLNVESSEYMPVVSVFGEYSLQSHNKKTYQPTAKEVITCNTDYLPEYINGLIDEMMLSEFVYLENDDTYLPVNVNKKSYDKKTRTFDKLIQYTFDFEYSFSKMNNVI